MNTRLQRSAAFTASAIVVRTIRVNQSAGQTSPTIVNLGGRWAGEPRALTVGDQTLVIRDFVTIPRLSDGLHSATVELATGTETKVVLDVRSAHD